MEELQIDLVSLQNEKYHLSEQGGSRWLLISEISDDGKLLLVSSSSTSFLRPFTTTWRRTRIISGWSWPVAVPFAIKLFPVVDWEKLFNQSIPEIVEVATRCKTPKQAAKSAIRRTIKKQVCGRARRKSFFAERGKRGAGPIFFSESGKCWLTYY